MNLLRIGYSILLTLALCTFSSPGPVSEEGMTNAAEEGYSHLLCDPNGPLRLTVVSPAGGPQQADQGAAYSPTYELEVRNGLGELLPNVQVSWRPWLGRNMGWAFAEPTDSRGIAYTDGIGRSRALWIAGSDSSAQLRFEVSNRGHRQAMYFDGTTVPRAWRPLQSGSGAFRRRHSMASAST